MRSPIAIAVKSGDTWCRAEIPAENFVGSFASVLPSAGDEQQLIEQALARPIGSAGLDVLAKNANSAVIICSDHTRPVPSRLIIPVMLRELRRGNPELDIALLIATGCHRDPTPAELTAKFGPEIVRNEKIFIHHAQERAEQVKLGILPSGGELWIDRKAAETDLLLSEGFIEPHFFAGFSGGRKAVLPGIAGRTTVLANHCAEFIDHAKARAGILSGNPIHADMLFAARKAKLRFIVNVVIDHDHKVVAAVAGDTEAAHVAGTEFLRRTAELDIPESDIVVTGNGGFPLDQNVYQCVKGMCTAEAVVKKGGVIIICAECRDGHGGDSFYRHLRDREPAELLREIRQVPRDATIPDQWQYQIMARIMLKARIIFVSDPKNRSLLRDMRFMTAPDLPKAIELAFELTGPTAKVAVIPDGVSIIPRPIPEN